MKKVILFFLLLSLTVGWAGSKEVYKSVDCVLSEPYNSWHLAIDDRNYIRKATAFEKIFYRAGSIFSDFHKKKLQQALEHTVEEIKKYPLSFLSDSELISLEKIACLLSDGDDNFWFNPIDISSMPLNGVSWRFKRNENQNPELIRPCIHDGLFYNDENEIINGLSITEIALFIKSIFTPATKIDLNNLVKCEKVLPRSDKLNIQWLGHSSFLIQLGNLNILTDPVTEPFHPILGGMVRCFKRYIPPGIALPDLPKIDVVIISHNHLDHLEDKALLYLKRYNPQILVPWGLKKYFEGKGFKNVHEHMWWDDTVATSEGGKELHLFCVPAKHNSMARGGVPRQGSLWCGFVIEGEDRHIYFAGDTAFNELMFKQIKDRFGSIDEALLPVAPDKMWGRHIDHLDALKAIKILDAKTMIPMHWGAYRTGDETIEKPYLRMKKEQEGNVHYSGRIQILKVGQRYQEK